MDFERLEYWVLERCPLQQLEFRTESSVYVLTNPPEAAWWSLRYESPECLLRKRHQVRGLKNVVTLIEQVYPDFYAWLVWRFPTDGKTP